MAFTGMDLEAVSSIATGLDKQAADLGAAVHAVDTAAQQACTSWQGPDAARFTSDWSTRYRGQLVAAQTALSVMATTARRNVQEQTTASNDLTGAVPISGSGPGRSGGRNGTNSSGDGGSGNNNEGGGAGGPGAPAPAPVDGHDSGGDGGSGGNNEGGGAGGPGDDGDKNRVDGLIDDSKGDSEDTPLGEKGDPADGPYTYAGSDGKTEDPGAGINGAGMTAHGSSGAGEDNGTYYAAAGGSAAIGVHGDASQSGSVGDVGITGHEQVLLGGQASGHAGASAGPDGLYAAAGGAAAIGLIGSATSTQSYGSSGISSTETATGMVGARADANAGASIGPGGASVSGGASAFVGGQGAVTGGLHTGLGSGNVTAGVSYGLGASAHGDLSVSAHNVDIGGDLGVTLGLGFKLGGNIQFDPEADLDSVGHALKSGGDFNPLNW